MSEENNEAKKNITEDTVKNSATNEKAADENANSKKKKEKLSEKLNRLGDYASEHVSDKAFELIIKAFMVCCCLFAIMFVSDVLNGFRISVHFSPDSNVFLKGMYFVQGMFDTYKVIYTFMIVLAAYLILKGIDGSTYRPLVIIFIVTILYGLINTIVIDTRGGGIQYSDFFAIKTALSVANAVKIRFHLVRYLLVILTLIIMYTFFYKKVNISIKIGAKAQVVYVVVGLALLITFRFTYLIPKDVNIWDTNDAYHLYGVPLTLMSSRDYTKALSYGNYDEEKVNSALSQYTADEYDETKKYPNIIFVLNESFCDIDEIYEVNPKVDPLKNYHEIINRDNIVKGVAYSPVYGGGTCIPEFELITQKSASIINPSFSPYLIIGSEHYKSSVMMDLKKYDYTTYGLHTYYGSGYNRKRIYDVFGFDKYMFVEDLDEGEEWFQNALISDEVTYKYLFRQLDNKEPGKREFDFVLTVQNHTPYDYRPYEFEDSDENKQPKYVEDEELNSYLSCLKLSDDALKDLVDYVDNMEEDTVLLFLGDHQPEIKVLDDGSKVRDEYKDDEAYKKVVQFFIYANYDIEEKDGIRTTMYYLPNIVYELLDLPMDEYYKYLKDLREEIPVINSEYYEDRYGNRYKFSDESIYAEKLGEFYEVSKYELFN